MAGTFPFGISMVFGILIFEIHKLDCIFPVYLFTIPIQYPHFPCNKGYQEHACFGFMQNVVKDVYMQTFNERH